jgi:myo-inositol-1(or 4)-monophosphatase
VRVTADAEETQAPDTAELLGLAEEFAREAGRLIVEQRPPSLSVTKTKSSATDIVTEMDQASERLLASRIHAARPDDALLGEEGAERTGTTGVTWVVDPIDGTVNYLYGIPSYAVSVGVRYGGEVVVGVVVNPVSGEVWTARKGGGAFLDGKPVRVNDAPELSMALIGTGFGYAAARRERQARWLTHVLPRVRDIRRAGAASLDLCALATGRLDGYYEKGLKPWDLAAGGLVAQEAGARVGGLGGRAAGEAFTVAAPEPLFSDLAALLEPLLAEEQ